MKGLLDFVKVTLAGGFIVVLPMMIIYLLLDELLELAIALAKPMLDLLPEAFTDEVKFPTLFAIVLIVLVSFLFGLVLRTGWGKGVIQGAERAVLEKIPGYSAIRSLTRSIAGDEIEAHFQPALLTLPLEGRALVFVVEEHANGRFTVFLPSSPTPGVGSLQIVSAERVQKLDASASQLFDVLSHWGIGAQDVVPLK